MPGRSKYPTAYGRDPIPGFCLAAPTAGLAAVVAPTPEPTEVPTGAGVCTTAGEGQAGQPLLVAEVVGASID